jgi:hypothetical protein
MSTLHVKPPEMLVCSDVPDSNALQAEDRNRISKNATGERSVMCEFAQNAERPENQLLRSRKKRSPELPCIRDRDADGDEKKAKSFGSWADKRMITSPEARRRYGNHREPNRGII